MSDMSQLPAPCVVTTQLPDNVCISVRAEAIRKTSRDLQQDWRADFRPAKQDKEGLLASVSTVRFILGEDLVPYSVLLTFEIVLGAAGESLPWRDIARLNAIVADHALRGLWPATHTQALGQCQLEGERLRISPLSLDLQRAGLELLKEQPPMTEGCLLLPAIEDSDCAVLHEAICTRHPELEIFDGRTLVRSRGGNQRSATVYFPIVEIAGTGEADRLLPVSVHVRSVEEDEEAALEFSGVHNADEQRHIHALIEALRAADNPACRRWRTRIHLPAEVYSGRSYELALVLADRLARGRDFGMPPGKRLIATGALSRQGETLVETCKTGAFGSVLLPTTTLKEKCRLFERLAMPGDRVLAPGNWRNDPVFITCCDALRTQGISAASIGNVLATL